jgi:hypothetical protein
MNREPPADDSARAGTHHPDCDGHIHHDEGCDWRPGCGCETWCRCDDDPDGPDHGGWFAGEDY